MQVNVRAAALLERTRQMPPWRFDAALATGLVVIGLITTARDQPGLEARDSLAIALVLAATIPHYARRRAPVSVFVVSVTATAALYVRDHNGGALSFVVFVGAYTVASHRPARDVVFASAYMYGAFVVMLAAHSADYGPAEFATSIPMFGAAIAGGWATQTRRARADALERDHGQATLRAAADERLRIAQELHDVIGHSLGVIAVQAGVGMHLIDTDPAEAKRALEHISRASRSSLAEIRRLLGLVRSGEGAASYAPTPRLADLSRLADEVTDAGLPVTLSVAADVRDVPPGVELAAYRIVQEALTNARKHARAHGATVELAADSGTLHIVVTDDGAGAASKNGAGHGLVGMRERVAVYGGTLDVGPAPEGGYRVSATLPYQELA